MNVQVEFGVEYTTNPNEGEQWVKLARDVFEAVLRDHAAQGVEPVVVYDRFTIFENGRSGTRLTIRDDAGVFYNSMYS